MKSPRCGCIAVSGGNICCTIGGYTQRYGHEHRYADDEPNHCAAWGIYLLMECQSPAGISQC